MQPVICIRNKTRMMEALLQPTVFLDWIHRLKNCDTETSIKELENFDWEFIESLPHNETEVFEDSLNGSKISINMTPVKKQLNKSIQFSMDTSMLEVTLNDQTSVTYDEQEDVNACLIQIEVAAKTLTKLCHRYQKHDTKSIVESLSKMQDIVETLKGIFQSAESSECEDTSGNSINSANNTVIDMTNDIKDIFQSKDTNECKEKYATSIDISNVNSEVKPLKVGNIGCPVSHDMSPKKPSIQHDDMLHEKTKSAQKNVKFTNKTNR